MCNYTLMKMFENIIQCILQLVVIWRPLSYTKATKLQRSDLDLLIFNVFFFFLLCQTWRLECEIFRGYQASENEKNCDSQCLYEVRIWIEQTGSNQQPMIVLLSYKCVFNFEGCDILTRQNLCLKLFFLVMVKHYCKPAMCLMDGTRKFCH